MKVHQKSLLEIRNNNIYFNYTHSKYAAISRVSSISVRIKKNFFSDLAGLPEKSS